MKIFQDIFAIRGAIKDIRHQGKSIGLVPTMGALHAGHLSLLEASTKENDVTITTIFVNPIQFNNSEDLKNYPSTYEDDITLLEKCGCNIVFAPTAKEMYPTEPVIKISFGELAETMEGAFRPGHFTGVALVVMKLFNILQPTRVYFGQKDLQQFKIIEQMVYDTSLDVELKMVPTVRERSGLALSSRNKRLSKVGKVIAAHIYQALKVAAAGIQAGNDIKASINAAKSNLQSFEAIDLEYLIVVRMKDLQSVETSYDHDQLVLCFAGYVDGIRLIDNLIINE
jgi:pantoate--beta-alanine ligase